MRQVFKISGIAYLLIFIAGFYANFAILESLVDLKDPITTTTNIINNHIQFGYGLIGFVVMVFFDLLLVWSLFKITVTVSKRLSYLASILRLLHALIFIIGLIYLFKIYLQTSNAINSNPLQEEIMILLVNFDILWTIGLLFFAIHLLILGYLGLKSSTIPSTLGILLIMAALGYFIDSSAKLFLENYSQFKSYFEMGVILTGLIGELSFTIWLFFKGFKKTAYQIKSSQSL